LSRVCPPAPRLNYAEFSDCLSKTPN
jgi:hypothetical protein